MRKRRNRVYRRIAVALTVALLAGQSHAFVLAEEDAGGAPQTEITGEADTSTSDNSNVADGGNADNGSGGNAGGTEQGGGNGGTDNQNPDDNGNQGDQQGDGDGQDKCICGTKCAADAVNTDCPVCAADYEACAGKADDAGNNGPDNDDTENNDPENGGQDNTNSQNAGEEVIPSEDAVLAEMASTSMSDEEAGIDALADEGAEAYAVGDTFEYTYEGQTLKYTVTKEDGDTREVEVAEQGEDAVSNRVIIPESVIKDSVTYRVTSIGGAAFYECESLTSVEIPDGVTSIGIGAFNGCTSLTSIKIPDGVTSIGMRAFAICTSLTSIKIPDSVISIEQEAFASCTSLTSIKIPDSMTTIQRDVFWYCPALKSVTISDKVSYFHNGGFRQCGQLQTMYMIVTSNETIEPPEVNARGGVDPFFECPTDRVIVFKAADGVTRETLEKAKKAYLEAGRKDHDPDDGKWWGWTVKEPTEVEDTYKVTVNANKDDQSWTTGCDKAFALTKDGGTTFVTNLDAVEAGDYEIVDATDSGNRLKTGVVVKVADTDASATVEYYTVAFCYHDDDGNEQTYGDSTDWKPQTILKTVGRVTKPATNPTKADHTFDKWVTASNGETAFAFETTPITEKDTKIYAKWTENTVTTYHTVTFYDGTTPYGADTPQKPQSVADGQTADKPEDPQKAGWEFAGWKTKTADGGSTDYNFDTPVTGDTDIYASWVKKTVTDPLRIRATATEGGTIDPEGEIIVSKGGERTFTITPDEGNKIKAVTVDDEDVTADLKETRARVQAGARYYTFTNIVKDHTIHAEFEKDGNGGGDNPNPNPKPDPDGESGGFGGEPKDHSSSDVQNNAGTEQVIMVSETSSPQAENSAPITSGAKQSPSAQAANGREPKTGDASYLEVYATLAMIAGLTYLLLYVMEESRGMSEREKEAFVAAFIRWGKKGGTFRKCCAMAAIFCLLAYYHIIGKNVGENALRKKHLGQAF